MSIKRNNNIGVVSKEALKVGGQFHYAPDLPFVEKYLDTKKYEINKYNINGLNYKATVIKRLE